MQIHAFPFFIRIESANFRKNLKQWLRINTGRKNRKIFPTSINPNSKKQFWTSFTATRKKPTITNNWATYWASKIRKPGNSSM